MILRLDMLQFRAEDFDPATSTPTEYQLYEKSDRAVVGIPPPTPDTDSLVFRKKRSHCAREEGGGGLKMRQFLGYY